ncbi:MAG: transglutaminase-like domain-containing protein [Gammaproteobacteria bacterium]
MDKVVEFIELEVNKQILTGIEIPIFVDDFLRKRFHHKTNYLNHTNNWLLLFLNKLFPNKGLLGALDPEHIIKEVYGSCSQQAIIFQEIIKTFGFEYSSIGINAELINGENFGHFISAVKMDDKWYIFDTNLEPIYDRHDSEITSRLLTGDYETLKSLYPYTNFSDLSPSYNIVLRDQNSFPATNGLIFQKFTALVSNYIWLVLAIIALYIRKKI